MNQLLIAGVGLMLMVCGCGQKDFKKVADRYVREELLAKCEQREAQTFFEGGGRMFDLDGTTTVDRDVLLPLIGELSKLTPVKPIALVHPKNSDQALTILVELPSDTTIVDQMADAVQKADDKFSGLILQQWGREWLSLGLISEEAVTLLKKSNPEIEKQR